MVGMVNKEPCVDSLIPARTYVNNKPADFDISLWSNVMLYFNCIKIQSRIDDQVV